MFVCRWHSCVLNLFAGRYPELAQALWQAAGEPEDWQALLLAETAVSDGQQATPLVVYQQRLYLHRMWQSEGKIAQFIQRQHYPQDLEEKRVRDTLDSYFGQQPDDWQKSPQR